MRIRDSGIGKTHRGSKVGFSMRQNNTKTTERMSRIRIPYRSVSKRKTSGFEIEGIANTAALSTEERSNFHCSVLGFIATPI